MSLRNSYPGINSDPFCDKKYYQLFKELYTPLCRYCAKIVHNGDVAEDIVQEQFIYLWENWKRLKQIKSIESYLYKAVKNKSINHLNYWFSKNTTPLGSELTEIKHELFQLDPSELMEKKELAIIHSLYPVDKWSGFGKHTKN